MSERRRFLACLSDPSRFSLVSVLAEGPRCVTELAGLVGLSQSCTTRHLQALLREQIVVAERHGKRVVYALQREGANVHPVLRWACEPATATGNGAATATARTRRRADSRLPRPDELEVEGPFVAAAVEHESGWVSADGGASAGESASAGMPARDVRNPELPAGQPSADPVADDEPSTGSLGRARMEMDDFLL